MSMAWLVIKVTWDLIWGINEGWL